MKTKILEMPTVVARGDIVEEQKLEHTTASLKKVFEEMARRSTGKSTSRHKEVFGHRLDMTEHQVNGPLYEDEDDYLLADTSDDVQGE
jgi:hypothetical protein